jgi:ssDNA-binding Zn-finger/Zn-ribbon topoisomerase 1
MPYTFTCQGDGAHRKGNPMTTKVRCPNCKEVPYWRWALADDGTGGKECGVCGYLRPTKRRMSKRRLRLEATLRSLWAEGGA